MEARSLSECGVLSGWNLFEVSTTQKKHLIGYSPHYQFDVISDEIVSYHYDKKNKAATAITRAGVEYRLQGKPIKVNPKGHPLLIEFMQINQCSIRLIG